MKFNALVVAAMVITSVNAAGDEGLPGWLGGICGSKSRVKPNSQVHGQQPGVTCGATEREWKPVENGLQPGVPQGPSDDELGPGVPHEPSMYKARREMAQGTSENEPISRSPQDPSEYDSEPAMQQGPSRNRVREAVHKLESEMTQDSQRYKSKPAMVQDSQMHEQTSESSLSIPARELEQAASEGLSENELRLRSPQELPEYDSKPEMLQSSSKNGPKSESPPDSQMHRLDEPKDSGPTEKDRTCTRIRAELRTLWNEVYALNDELKEHAPGFYGLIMMKEGEGGKKRNLKVRMIQPYLALNPGAIPKLREIKAKYTGFGEKRCEILTRFDDNKCPETFARSSLEKMAQQGHLPNWKDPRGRDILRDQ
ncbi:hypothetical protein BASA83_006335 [Batrachochytrium salamandrivorans]|nr:hypothetical protein BASA81_011353 [Batrachochytrium salamandrivorans]KAH9271481.1 hypothetical protein BASA83_006335 [Batrachochytrium salamandrivorans]